MPGTTPLALSDLFASRIRELPQGQAWPEPSRSGSLISLVYGLADPELFPHLDLTQAAVRVLAEDTANALNYAPSSPRLLEQIATRMRSQGVEADSEQILISYGSSQILGLLPQLFVEPADIVLIEAPTFMGAVRNFREAGAQLIAIPVDQHGMDVDMLEQRLRDLRRQRKRPKLIYTIPNFHNPTGVTLSLARRQRLVALAAEFGVAIVEDDAYGALSFDQPPPVSLAALDQEGWVVYISTFSKILAPGLRTGWVYAQRPLIERLAHLKVEGSSGPFLTRLVAAYCEEGRLEAHIQRLRAAYQVKCQVMLDALARYCPPDLQVIKPGGGFFVWCRLPDGMSASALLEQAADRGVAFLAGERCYADGSGDDTLRLAFSLQPAAAIEAGIARLGQAINAMRG